MLTFAGFGAQLREVIRFFPYVKNHQDCEYCSTDMRGVENCTHLRIGENANKKKKTESNKIVPLVCFAFVDKKISAKANQHQQAKITQLVALCTLFVSLIIGIILPFFRSGDHKEIQRMQNELRFLNTTIEREKRLTSEKTSRIKQDLDALSKRCEENRETSKMSQPDKSKTSIIEVKARK